MTPPPDAHSDTHSDIPSRRDRLFDEALALPPETREAFVEEACPGDPALRDELLSLLRAHDAADGFFEGLSRRWVAPLRSAGVSATGGTGSMASPRRPARPGTPEGAPPSTGSPFLFSGGHLLPGTRLGRHEVLGVLGEGGMGVVYRALDPKLDREVALKLLPRDLVADPEARAALLAEARAVARLDHPHVGVIHEVGETDDAGVFLAMALHQGETLAERLRRGPLPLPVADVLRIGQALASALEAAHQAGIVHRDVKPSNVLLTDGGGVRLVDFGIATALGSLPSPRGSRGYASPETTAGDPVDARTDLWSLGVLLHELVTGVRPPPPGEGLPALEALEGDETRGPVHHGLIRAIRLCLAPEPGGRPERAGQILEMLGTTEEPGSRGARRRLRPAVMAFAGVGTLAVALAGVLALAPGLARGPMGEDGVRAGEDGLRAGGPGVGTPGGAPEGGSPPWRSAHRVLVLPFEDRSGDPEFASVGIMAADWITEGISRAGVANVVDPASTLAAHRETGDPVALAGLFQAGLVVAGGYHLDGDSLRFQLRLVDGTDGTMIRTLTPVAASRRTPLDGLEPLRQTALGAVALHLDPRTTRHELLVTETPPSWEAFLAFVRAKEHFVENRWAQAREEIVLAETLDPTFYMAVFYGGIAAANLGDFEDLRARRERLGRLIPASHRTAQFGLDFLDAILTGDHEASYRIHRRAVDEGILAPSTMGHAQLVLDAVTLGRFREAITVAQASDPTRGELRGWYTYWGSLAMAHHALGEYEEELDAARRARETLGPLRSQPLFLEARALAALGELEALDAVVQEGLRVHAWPSSFLRWTGDYLEIHGHPEEAERRYGAAVARARSDLARDPSPDRTFHLALALLSEAAFARNAGRPPDSAVEARELFQDLHDESPALLDPVMGLGATAALLDNPVEARRRQAELLASPPDGRFGGHVYRAARISALLGETDDMAELLERAYRLGYRLQYAVREDPFILAHREHPWVAALLRPR